MLDKPFWRKIHRLVGLLLVGFVVFYGVTGLLLNHRQDFSYFQTRSKTVIPVQVQDQGLMLSFIDSYRQQINRDDSPKVIRIKDGGVIEFLYGSHGRTTYIIDPQAGTMTRVDKMDNQPWHWLNRLHKAYKTSGFWQVLTDGIGLLILFLTGTGLVILNYSRRDIVFLAGGAGLLILGLWLA